MRLRRLVAANLLLVSLFLFLASSVSAFEITSTPTYTVDPFDKWEYNITSDTSWVGNITVTSTLGNDLVLQDWNLSYLPTEDAIGLYAVNITLHDTVATVETYDYQNFTLEVTPTTQTGDYLILALVLGFGLIGVGFIDGRLMFLAGIVWVYISFAVLGEYGIPWMLIGLGFGLAVLIDGALNLAEGSDS